MDIYKRLKLKAWIERKYYTESSVNDGQASIIVKKELMESDGVAIHTDGIIEKNKKDFDMYIVSGYNYAVICKFGKEFKYKNEPRIIVYCNHFSSWGYYKLKYKIIEILRKYQ